MSRCSNGCLDKLVPVKVLAERGTLTAEYHAPQPEVIVVTITCAHGGSRRHSVYPASPDWAWAVSIVASPRRIAA